MKTSKLVKMITGVALSTALVVTSVAAPAAKKAEAKAKKYKCNLVYMDDASKITSFKANNKYSATTTVKNTKGTKRYKVTLKRSNCYKQGTNTKSAKGNMKYTRVLCLDVVNAVKDHKVKRADKVNKAGKKVKPTKLKFSNVVIKVDGKKIKIRQAKLNQGWIEYNTKNYRLDIFNIWNYSANNYKHGGSNKVLKQRCCVTKDTVFNFKKSLSVEFSFTIK
ncbi:MAG: hypothetical protein K6D02_05030 [Lachnospiraceae bacterium]|nr:hypothetical protein [Lachnospiraceae bacterium]